MAGDGVGGAQGALVSAASPIWEGVFDAERDHKWIQWGKATAYLGLSPVSPEALQLWHHDRACEWIVYFHELIASERLDALSRTLGTLWDREEILKPIVRPNADVKQIRVPLTTLLNPDLMKALREFIGKAKDKRGRAIQELGAFDREAFLEFMSRYSKLNVAGKPKK